MRVCLCRFDAVEAPARLNGTVVDDLAQGETIPAGYEASGAIAQSMHLDGAKPARVEVILPANRSIAGTVHVPAGASASIKLMGLDRTGTIDDGGRYVFRGLKPGTYTVEAVVAGQTITRVVEVPAGPPAVRDIDFP